MAAAKAKITTKSDLVDAVAAATDQSKAASGGAVNALLDAITSALKKGNKVSITGFGSFQVRKRKARTGRNPRTGATIKIAASKVPAFTAGKALKDAVGGKK